MALAHARSVVDDAATRWAGDDASGTKRAAREPWGTELWGLTPDAFLWLLRPHFTDLHTICVIHERGVGVVAQASTNEPKLQEQLVPDPKGRYRDRLSAQVVGTECARRFAALNRLGPTGRPRVVFDHVASIKSYHVPVLAELCADAAAGAGLWLSRLCARADCTCRMGDENIVHCRAARKVASKLAASASTRVIAYYEMLGLGKYQPSAEAYAGRPRRTANAAGAMTYYEAVARGIVPPSFEPHHEAVAPQTPGCGVLPGPNPVPTPQIPTAMMLPPVQSRRDGVALPNPPASIASRASAVGRGVPWTAAAPGEFDDFVALVQGRPIDTSSRPRHAVDKLERHNHTYKAISIAQDDGDDVDDHGLEHDVIDDEPRSADA